MSTRPNFEEKREKFNALNDHFNNPVKKKPKDIEKSAEYFARNIMPTYKYFKPDFHDKNGVEFSIPYGEYSDDWYKTNNQRKFNKEWASYGTGNWGTQLLFMRIKKKIRDSHGLPQNNSDIKLNSEDGISINGVVQELYIDPKRATGYVVVDKFISTPSESLLLSKIREKSK